MNLSGYTRPRLNPWCHTSTSPTKIEYNRRIYIKFHCEPGRASFSSHNMRKWLFHPFLRWINGVWIEIVFSSGKIHMLNMWNSFVSIVIFLSYYKRRKNVHEVFSSLDQFQLKFPNVVFLSASTDEKYTWGFFIPGSISAEIPSGEFRLKLIQEI